MKTPELPAKYISAPETVEEVKISSHKRSAVRAVFCTQYRANRKPAPRMLLLTKAS